MRVTNQGVLLDEVYDVQESAIFSGSYAIIDSTGACIQIPANQLEKILIRYQTLKNQAAQKANRRPVAPAPTPAPKPAPPKKEEQPLDLDKLFT